MQKSVAMAKMRRYTESLRGDHHHESGDKGDGFRFCLPSVADGTTTDASGPVEHSLREAVAAAEADCMAQVR